jgi:hypothetical protein
MPWTQLEFMAEMLDFAVPILIGDETGERVETTGGAIGLEQGQAALHGTEGWAHRTSGILIHTFGMIFEIKVRSCLRCSSASVPR